MKRILLVALLIAFEGSATAFAQNPPTPENSTGEVTLSGLANPVYPPLARQANITGDVQVKLEIRRDGSVQSASVLRGHPMLAPVALSSARQSQYECRGCVSEVATYSLTYSFLIEASPGWPCPESPGPHTTQTANHVTVKAEPRMLSLYFSNVRVRSAKCLYLWRCTSMWGGDDYYFYRYRSPKCLGLWNCGRALREPLATCHKLHRRILD